MGSSCFGVRPAFEACSAYFAQAVRMSALQRSGGLLLHTSRVLTAAATAVRIPVIFALPYCGLLRRLPFCLPKNQCVFAGFLRIATSHPDRMPLHRVDIRNETGCYGSGDAVFAMQSLILRLFTAVQSFPDTVKARTHFTRNQGSWERAQPAGEVYMPQALRTLRPRRRRADSTRRPFLVDIRARKPCTLLRWIFLGW